VADATTHAGGVAAMGQRIAAAFRAWVPDPFVIAIALTLLTAALTLALGDFPALDPDASIARRATALIDAWRSADSGLWRFLAFGMQMCLILVTGYALAASQPVSAGLDRLVALAGTPRRAVWMVATTAAVLGLLNWGLSLMAGALLASRTHQALRRRGTPAPLPILAAAGYLGLLVWHGGLSGSAPFTVTSTQAASTIMDADQSASLIGEGVSLGRTILSPLNLAASGGVVLLAPALLALLTPRGGSRPDDSAPAPNAGPPPRALDAHPNADDDDTGVVAFLARTPLVPAALALLLVVALVRHGSTSGWLRPGLNEVNAAMLALGLLAHGSARSYLRAAEEGARACSGVILQFPLYGGIMGMMASSGLADQLAAALSEATGPVTAPLATYASAAVLNVFVPSGGGQWAIQGPIALRAAADAGVDPARIVLAVAYGDQLTNMLQPFWALPLLTITGARARDVVGYTAIVMAAAALWVVACLLVAGLLAP